ncbi:MBL fold metallo-hydrolase [Gephyromycinifex aptenodytis]|uniref:MBL fold metallo-hydrolase n=1 Tax=Gephyromycinifex aptenodytis TaxID=2716227 RepID=UPI0014465EB1|nr:MBL fold metallo-hydrolase [Gephyromycinifex aptenodytis]
MREPEWVEVADGVFVWQHSDLLLNCGLVVGEKECLVVDAGAGDARGRELAHAVRRVSDLPWRVVVTHGHYDHALGVSAFTPCPVYAHHRMPARFTQWLREGRQATVAELREAGADELAQLVATATPVSPDHLVTQRQTLDLGGRSVTLIPLGPAHTDHDLVVAVPGSGAVFWGDVVEEGADPDFEGSYPLEWGQSLSRLLDSAEVGLAGVNVPGHGSVMTREGVEEQCVALIRLSEALRVGKERGADPAALVSAASVAGFGEPALEVAAQAVLDPQS